MCRYQIIVFVNAHAAHERGRKQSRQHVSLRLSVCPIVRSTYMHGRCTDFMHGNDRPFIFSFMAHIIYNGIHTHNHNHIINIYRSCHACSCFYCLPILFHSIFVANDF